jgi:hypothetical protein
VNPTPALVPLGFVTVTLTGPAWPAGLVAVIDVPVALTVTLVAGVLPNLTAVTPARPLPLRVTTVPPVVDPVAGLMPDTAGTYVYRVPAFVRDVPTGFVTVTSTVPLGPAGLVSQIAVPLPAKPIGSVALVVPK